MRNCVSKNKILIEESEFEASINKHNGRKTSYPKVVIAMKKHQGCFNPEATELINP
jgi:hypothetical protein